MTNLSVLKYKAPVVTLSLDPLVAKIQAHSIPVSHFIPQPEGYTASLPGTIATSTVSGTGAVPALGGVTPAAGSNVAAGGLSTSGSFGSSSFDPLTDKTYAENGGVVVQTGYTFIVTTSFSPGMPSTGATAVLYSDTGSPTWVGTSVPLNGSFRLDPSVFTAGDIVRVKVTPASPSAHLIGYSNGVPFTTAGVTFKRVSRTSTAYGTSVTTAVVGTTNYIWFVSTPPSSATGNNAPRLFRMHKSTEVVDQAVNINGYSTTDTISILGVIGDVVFFVQNNTSAVGKLFSVNESLTITQVSNHANNNATTDAIAALPVVTTANFEGTTLNFNSCLYYFARNTTGFRKLFKVDGSGTITQITNTSNNQGSTDAGTIFSAALFNGAIYVPLNNASNVTKMFKITAANGVTAIGDTRNATATTDSIVIRAVTTNFLYYTANNSNGVNKMYRINTSDTPSQILNFSGAQATADTYGTSFASFNNCLYFVGRSNSAINNTFKVYKVDDAGSTISNISSPLAKDGLGALNADNNFLMTAGSVLLIHQFGADNTPMLFYVTSSDVLTRADQPFFGYANMNLNGTITINGRVFVLMTAIYSDNNGAGRTLFEVLPTTFKLRQVAATTYLAANAQFTLSGHISGSNAWLPIVWTGNTQIFVTKMTVS